MFKPVLNLTQLCALLLLLSTGLGLSSLHGGTLAHHLLHVQICPGHIIRAYRRLCHMGLSHSRLSHR